MSRAKLVIGALSAKSYAARRQACLETWAQRAGELNVDVMFLVGDSPRGLPYREGSVLHCPCPDNYASLPQKTRWFCLWAVAQGEFDYLLKCDDDTYVGIDRLLELVDSLTHSANRPDYLGHDLGGYASGGAGYLLSRGAALSVVGRLFEARGAEDVLVKAVLAQAGIGFTPEPRFHPWNDRWPEPGNRLITTHYCAPERMRALHAALYSTAVSERKESSIPRVFHHIWLGGKPLPLQFQQYIEGWKARHTGWEFKLWTEHQLFPLQNQREFDQATSLAQRADIARYEVLYREGGVYLDTDFECLRNLEPLLVGLEGFAAEEDEHSVAIGILGAVPRHGLLQELIEALPASFAEGGSPVQSTGPGFFTKWARRRTDFQIFDRRLFYPTHYSGAVWGPLSEAFAVHHWAHSWRS